MNVQPGNLARVVAPYCEQGRGAIVTVVRRAVPPIEELNHILYAVDDISVIWVVSGFVKDGMGRTQGPLLCIGDVSLRRIDGDSADEISTLRVLETV